MNEFDFQNSVRLAKKVQKVLLHFNVSNNDKYGEDIPVQGYI